MFLIWSILLQRGSTRCSHSSLLPQKVCSGTDPVASCYQRWALTCKVRFCFGSRFLTASQKLEVSDSGLISSK